MTVLIVISIMIVVMSVIERKEIQLIIVTCPACEQILSNDGTNNQCVTGNFTKLLAAGSRDNCPKHDNTQTTSNDFAGHCGLLVAKKSENALTERLSGGFRFLAILSKERAN